MLMISQVPMLVYKRYWCLFCVCVEYKDLVEYKEAGCADMVMNQSNSSTTNAQNWLPLKPLWKRGHLSPSSGKAQRPPIGLLKSVQAILADADLKVCGSCHVA